MKFKEFLEAASYDRTISEMLGTSRIPLTDNITKSLGFGKKMIAYHATDLSYLKTLSKLGKTSKQISAFTHGLGSLVNSISIKPDILAKIEGIANIEFNGDIFSHPDKSGRRWIGTRGTHKSTFLQDALNFKTINNILKYTGSDISNEELINNDFLYIKEFEKLDNKQKDNIIKLYIDNAEKLFKKTMYIDILKEIIENTTSNSPGTYDEIIMNKFKVLGVYSIENGKFAYDHSMAQYYIEKDGYKYLGHISKEEYRNY